MSEGARQKYTYEHYCTNQENGHVTKPMRPEIASRLYFCHGFTSPPIGVLRTLFDTAGGEFSSTVQTINPRLHLLNQNFHRAFRIYYLVSMSLLCLVA